MTRSIYSATAVGGLPEVVVFVRGIPSYCDGSQFSKDDGMRCAKTLGEICVRVIDNGEEKGFICVVYSTVLW